MKNYRLTTSTLILAAAAAAALSGTISFAQAKAARAKAPAVQTEADKNWKQTYLADGQPDWQGYWRANPGGDTYDISGIVPRPDTDLQGDGAPRVGIHRIPDTPDGKIPYQPWAATKAADLALHVDNPIRPEHIDTQAHCLPEGPARVFIHSGFQILQAPGYVIFFSEANDESRIVPIDGHPHLGSDIKLWQGDSRGHWESNSLIIDVTNVKAKSRLDMKGDFYSPTAHFVEKFTRVDAKTIQYEAHVTDPSVYTQPFTITARFVPNHGDDPGFEMWEYSCHEGEQSADRMVIPPDAAKELGLKP